MNKRNLPNHWIEVTSKSHPDRVYFFNVKTGKSSWTEPLPEDNNQTGAKTRNMARKRKKAGKDMDSKESEPVTPEHDFEKGTNLSNRKKLVAKRSQPATPAQEKDTPQMQVLREKLKKKNKTVPLTDDSSIASQSKVNPPLRKPNVKKKLADSTSEGVETSSISGYTPQMRALYDKIQGKSSVGVATKKLLSTDSDNNNVNNDAKNADNKEVKTSARRRKTRNLNKKSITATPPLRIPKLAQCAEGNNKKKILKDDDLLWSSVSKERLDNCTVAEVPPNKKRRKSSLKNNLAEERMEKLRTSLNSESTELANIGDVSSSQDAGASSSYLINSDETLPSIYKNVDARLKNVCNRVLKNKARLSRTNAEDQMKDVESVDSDVTAGEELVKQCIDSTFYEEMDWEPMEDERITFEVQAVRTQLYSASNVDPTNCIPNITLNNVPASSQSKKKPLYIVIDTNVFLSNIKTIEEVRDATFKTYDQPIIVVPWTVIRELDYIKDNRCTTKPRSLCANARKAVRFLHEHFTIKHPRIVGQAAEDVRNNKEKFAIDCPDDEILQTCLQIRESGKHVILLSYDKNLCNKAMIYDVVTLGRFDPLEKIDYLDANDNSNLLSTSLHIQIEDGQTGYMSILKEELQKADEIFENAKIIIAEFLTVIISMEMHALYGEGWEKYSIIRPPWTAVTALKCAIKYWIAAVGESFLRKAEVILKELLKAFETFPEGGRRLKDVQYILEECSDLMQMVNTEKHTNLMIRASEKIDELRNKCREYENLLSQKRLQNEMGAAENTAEQELKAKKALQYFEVAYTYARDMCGMAAEAVGMPCTFSYTIPNPVPSIEYIKQMQPEVAANVNRLLHILSAVLEQASNSNIDHRTLVSLHQALTTFSPGQTEFTDDFTPVDIYCCVKQKESLLRTGLRQLQELSTHFCRLASYKCT